MAGESHCREPPVGTTSEINILTARYRASRVLTGHLETIGGKYLLFYVDQSSGKLPFISNRFSNFMLLKGIKKMLYFFVPFPRGLMPLHLDGEWLPYIIFGHI